MFETEKPQNRQKATRIGVVKREREEREIEKCMNEAWHSFIPSFPGIQIGFFIFFIFYFGFILYLPLNYVEFLNLPPS